MFVDNFNAFFTFQRPFADPKVKQNVLGFARVLIFNMNFVIACYLPQVQSLLINCLAKFCRKIS